MTDFASWIHGGRRRLGLAAALVGASIFLAAGESIPSAEAKTTRADLSQGAAGSGTGAQGRIQLKQQRRGERLKIRLDNLQPRTDYEVRDGATDDLLGTVRTDRRGRAKKTIRAAAGRTLSGAMLEICEPGSGDPILEGRVPGEPSGMPWYDGTFLVGTVSTDPEAAVQVSITLSSTTSRVPPGDPTFVGPDGNAREGDPAGGEATYDSISLFAGPGGVWIMDGGAGGGVPEFPSIPGPVTFWIADGEDGLVQVASIEGGDWGRPMPLPASVARMGAGDGTDGMIFPMPDSYSWYADNLTEPGLPLGVAAVADLSGRSFEVRDGEGAVLLDGVLPQMEEIVPEPLPEPKPWPDFPCPGGGFNIDIDISINIDLSAFDWGSFDLGALLGGDGMSFDFTKLLGGLRF